MSVHDESPLPINIDVNVQEHIEWRKGKTWAPILLMCPLIWCCCCCYNLCDCDVAKECDVVVCVVVAVLVGKFPFSMAGAFFDGVSIMFLPCSQLIQSLFRLLARADVNQMRWHWTSTVFSP